MRTMIRRLWTLSLLLVASLAIALPAHAAKVHMKDGRVLEGRIAKEGDGFVYLIIMVGGVEHQELLTANDIKKIERDAAADPKPDEAAAALPGETTSEPRARTVIPPGATKIAFISLEETVGPYLNADALLRSVELLDKLPEAERPDIVVLRINSGGGALAEVEPLSDAIHLKMKPKYRVVAWIQSAISAASMTGLNCEEIYFMKQGNFGGTVGFSMTGPGQAKAIEGEGLEHVLLMGEKLSKRGGYNPLIMRAMQILMPLSCTIDADGNVTWEEGTGGQYIVNPPDRILTLNSTDALKYKFSRGTADTKDELAKLMGCKEWVEVGPEADKYQREFRAAVKEADARTQELLAKMNIAIQYNEAVKARTFLNELRSIARRAPSMAKYGNPPLSKEFFEDVEKQLRKIIDQQEKAKRDAEEQKRNRR